MIPQRNPSLIGLSLLLCAVIVWFYAWTVFPESGAVLVHREPSGYYNMLADGLAHGHCYLDVQPEPLLATLKNPWDPHQRGSHGLPDVSYYQGHYFIYFGVSPAITLFLPFHLITGRYLDESVAPPLFAALGFAASVWLLLGIRRVYFATASGWLTLAAILAVGLGNMMPVLLRRSGFWEAPITCGYACCMIGLAALFQSLQRPRPLPWLALAGVALGLAVGSRPLYLLVCPVLLVPLWVRTRERGETGRLSRRLGIEAAMALLPCAVVGLGLAWYNLERFGSPFEFGLKYQFWNQDPATTVRFAWRFFPFNLRAFILAPATWGWFFPFVNVVHLPASPYAHYGAEDPYGILPNMPYVVLALGSLILLVSRAHPLRLRAITFAVAFGAVAMTISMLFFQAALNRYMIDFVPAIVLLACLGAYALAGQPRTERLVTVLAGGLALYSALFNVLASFRHNELLHSNHPTTYARLAHAGNEIPWFMDRLQGIEYGPVEMSVVFPVGRHGSEPLISTGRSFLSDYLVVFYTSPTSVQFGLIHTSRGAFYGSPIPYDPGKPHTVRIDLGSLYPPGGHPYFDPLSPVQDYLRQKLVRVTLDGTIAFTHIVPAYDATSRTPSVGTRDGRLGLPSDFTGQILSWHRLAVDPPQPLGGEGTGARVLRLVFPDFTVVHDEPLISSGRPGQGDALCLRYLAADTVAIVSKHAGAADLIGPSVQVEPKAEQTITIDSPILERADLPADSTGRIDVRINQATALGAVVPFHPMSADTRFVGSDETGFSTVPTYFSGEWRSVATAPALATPSEGAIHLRLRLPPFSGVRNEPLLCRGVTGRADLIYIRYENPGHISFGYDHWGVSGYSSPPIAVDPAAIQDILIDPAGLPRTITHWDGAEVRSASVRIALNGTRVVDHPDHYYVTEPGTSCVGLNPIGASTAQGRFTGQLILDEPAPPLEHRLP